MPCQQIEDVATVARCAVCPQTSLLAIEDDLKTVAGATQDVANVAFATPNLACWKDRAQHRFETCEQGCTNLVAISAAASLDRRHAVIEIQWIRGYLLSHRTPRP